MYPRKRSKLTQLETEVVVVQSDDLKLKSDHEQRPLWIGKDNRIFLEAFSGLYKQASDFLNAAAEPVCRPENIHEYRLTSHSLYAAVSAGLETNEIITVLDRLCKTKLPSETEDFIRANTENYGKVRLVLRKNRYFVESSHSIILSNILGDEVISRARIHACPNRAGSTEWNLAMGEEAVHSFEIDPAQAELVKQRCNESLNYPMLEEYDFRNDSVNCDLDIKLNPSARLRPYQEKCLSKMFGNGLARSGIIVLPCGAGKSLVGVSAACRIRKSCLCLVTNSVSVDQWAYQFKLWSNIRDDQIFKFTSDIKEIKSLGDASVVVTTYNMIAFSGKRSEESEKVMEMIKGRDWGLLLMDEVHVVPAHMFRNVINISKSHCKLGLTATLVREDEGIKDLNFLIGPKLYEANWLDLAKEGHIANVQCAEVLCPMTKEFQVEYLKRRDNMPRALYVMNPNKFRACEFLIRFHEQQRRDKIIVFSDDLFALREYATTLGKPFIYGATSHAERMDILYAFKTNPDVNTIFLSKVGDNSIDIPEANVIIQISSHAGSRRQEAQRLGRILRSNPLRGDADAFFYSLVSKDTEEMYYSTKRRQFLIDQGYSFKVITSLPPTESGSTLSYHNLQDQLDLLQRVLNAGEETADKHDVDDMIGGTQSSAVLSSKETRPKSSKRNPLFKKRYKMAGRGMCASG